MGRLSARWFVYSTVEEGILPCWRELPQDVLWRLRREGRVERTGDGKWAEVRNEDGAVVMMLVRFSGVRRWQEEVA